MSLHSRGMGTMMTTAGLLMAEEDLHVSGQQALSTPEILESITDPFFAVDGQQRFTYMNREAERLLGSKREDLVGRSLWDAVPEESMVRHQGLLAALTERARTTLELSHPSSGRSFEVHLYPYPGGLTAYFRDVTDRRLMEEALRVSEERFRLMAENARDIVYRVEISQEPNGQGPAHGSQEGLHPVKSLPAVGFSYISPAVERVLGCSPEDLYADPGLVFKILHPEDRGSLDALLGAESPEDPVYARPLVLRWLRKDGSTVWIEARHVPVCDETGRLTAIEGIARDVTERQLAEKILRESEERYRTLVEAMDDLVSVKDALGRYVAVNSAHADRLGLPRDTFLGKTPLEMGDSPTHRRSMEGDQLVLTTGWRIETEYQEMTPTGLVTLSGYKVPLRDGSGRISGLVSVSRNVTEGRRVTEALRQSEAELRAIFDNAAIGIVLMDGSGRILKSNRAIETMLGYAETELAGKHFSEVTWPEDLSADLAQHDKLVAGTIDSCHIEKRYLRKDGRAVWGRVTASVVQRNEGQPSVILRLIEEVRAPQAALVQWEKMASIGELAAGVAHEINNPMGFIMSNLNTLGEYLRDLKQYLAEVEEHHQALLAGENGRVAQLLGEIRHRRQELDVEYILGDLDNLVAESVDGSRRVKRIVQDLRSFARADSSDVLPAQINSILDSALNIVWNQLKYHCTVDKEYGEVPEIPCNSNQLAQVFVNMLVNAGQAIDSGQKGRIGIKSYSTTGRVWVEISDNGKGISAENLQRIFDPFFTTKPVGQGTGLGLSISYGLIENHGGKIHVRSEVGAGTTFTVELPVVATAAGG